jgi:TolC family type I secretion outer membrane protein
MKHFSVSGRIMIFFLILCFPLPAFAADSPPTKDTGLSLSQAIKQAILQNPRTKASAYSIQQAEHQMTQAKSGHYPQIFFSETLNHTNNPMWAFGTRLNQGRIAQADFDPARLNDPSAITNFASVLSMEWTIYNGRQTQIGVEQAQSQIRSIEIQAEQTRQDVIHQTIKAYAGLILANQYLSVIEKTILTANAHLNMISARYDNGFTVKSDLLRAQVRVAELEQAKIQADSQVQIAIAVLNTVMGFPADEPLPHLAVLDQNPPVTGGDIETWVSGALSNHPHIRQMEILESVAAREIDKSRAGHLPQVSLIANYEIDSEKWDDFGDNYTLGAMMRMNLYSGDRLSAKTRESEAGLKRIQALLRDLKANVDVQARQSWLMTQSAWNRIRVTESAVRQAEEGLGIVENRYETGLYPLVSLLDAELSLQNSRTSRIQAIHDYLVARAGLYLAVGTLDENFN